MRAFGGGVLLAERTHCYNGHEFTPENTYTRHDGGRRCRACWRDANRRRYGRDANVALLSRVLVPTAPLRAYVEREFGGVSEVWPRDVRYNRYAYRPRISLALADEMACTQLGVHPFAIWGPAWFEFGFPGEEAAS